ncbi:MAG TPA: osmoprotectant transporter permease [Bacteroidia bacterium]|nr:osmoprotectant transporter permease [Bacteroidia bacterium]
MILFRILWVIDAIVALIVLYFFIIGLGDGSVSSYNSTLWGGILAALAGILGGSILLKSAGQLKIAKALLWVLAIPALLYGLFILVFVFSGAKWN